MSKKNYIKDKNGRKKYIWVEFLWLPVRLYHSHASRYFNIVADNLGRYKFHVSTRGMYRINRKNKIRYGANVIFCARSECPDVVKQNIENEFNDYIEKDGWYSIPNDLLMESVYNKKNNLCHPYHIKENSSN